MNIHVHIYYWMGGCLCIIRYISCNGRIKILLKCRWIWSFVCWCLDVNSDYVIIRDRCLCIPEVILSKGRGWEGWGWGDCLGATYSGFFTRINTTIRVNTQTIFDSHQSTQRRIVLVYFLTHFRGGALTSIRGALTSIRGCVGWGWGILISRGRGCGVGGTQLIKRVYYLMPYTDLGSRGYFRCLASFLYWLLRHWPTP